MPLFNTGFLDGILLRSIAVRLDSGRFLADPQSAYDYVCSQLQDRQVGIEELFWETNEDMSFVRTEVQAVVGFIRS